MAIFKALNMQDEQQKAASQQYKKKFHLFLFNSSGLTPLFIGSRGGKNWSNFSNWRQNFAEKIKSGILG